MIANPARTYRQLAGQGASSLNLVVQAHDQIVSSLFGAIRALQAGDIEKKTSDINHVLALISHLQNALDFDRGGEVARSLERFYIVQRGQILEASASASAGSLRQVVQQFMSMREAWQEVEKSTVPPAETRLPVSRPAPSTPDSLSSSSSQPSMQWSA